jgi:hypothetical protein
MAEFRHERNRGGRLICRVHFPIGGIRQKIAPSSQKLFAPSSFLASFDAIYAHSEMTRHFPLHSLALLSRSMAHLGHFCLNHLPYSHYQSFFTHIVKIIIVPYPCRREGVPTKWSFFEWSKSRFLGKINFSERWNAKNKKTKA